MIESDLSLAASDAPRDANAVPVSAMVEAIVGCKWSVQLLGLISDGCGRPSALLRAAPGLSAKVMHERLAKMLRFGIVQRAVFGMKPPLEVEYSLTPFGQRFMRIIDEVRKLQAAVDNGGIGVRVENHRFVAAATKR